MSVSNAQSNQLLSSLSRSAFKAISPALELHELKYKEVIFEPGSKIRYVYFPVSGIVSLLSVVGEALTLEVSIVGNDGMIGLPLYLGPGVADTRALVQGSGHALRIGAKEFLAECSRADELPRVLRLFTSKLISQISRSAVCIRYHEIEQRLSRWLLITADKLGTDSFQ